MKDKDSKNTKNIINFRNNKDLSKRDKKYVWHPYTQMQLWNSQNNKVITTGSDFYLIDEQNNKYLDGIANMWCSVWGYSSNPVIESICDQYKQLPHSTLFGLANKPSITLAEKLVKLTKGMSKVFYSDNGSTAMEVALKMSIQYWKNKGFTKKTKIVSLENGYHGDTIATMSMGYVDSYFNPYKSLLINTLKVVAPSSFEKNLDCDINESEIVEKCLAETESLFQKESQNIAVFAMESGAQIAGGVSIYPKKYQKKLSELCKKYDVLLILDEIATGFGRLGNMIEYIAQNSEPDIVCYGKALNGGYFPIAVTLTTKEVFDAFLAPFDDNKQFFHGHTYTGHPVGCTACIANIELYEKRKLLQQIQKNSEYIKKRTRELEEFSFVNRIRHKGLLLGIELIRTNQGFRGEKKNKKEPLLFLEGLPINHYIMKESLKRGVFLRSLGNIITLIPPLAIPTEELEILLNTSYDILKTIEKSQS